MGARRPTGLARPRGPGKSLSVSYFSDIKARVTKPRLLKISLALFVLCLPFRAFAKVEGWSALMFGFFGLGATPANKIWLANLIMLVSWMVIGLNYKVLSVTLSTVAVAMVLAFPFMSESRRTTDHPSRSLVSPSGIGYGSQV